MELNKAKVLSDDEFRELSGSLENNEKTDFRNTTLIWMLLHTGARVSEVLAIRSQDLVDEGMTVFIRGLKGSKDRELPLYPYLYNRMKVLAGQVNNDSGLIFNFGYHRARDIWAWYRPSDKRVHSIRHYRALQIYKKTKNLLIVQRVLGHRNVKSTMIYLEYAVGSQEIMQALM